MSIDTANRSYLVGQWVGGGGLEPRPDLPCPALPHCCLLSPTGTPPHPGGGLWLSDILSCYLALRHAVTLSGSPLSLCHFSLALLTPCHTTGSLLLAHSWTAPSPLRMWMTPLPPERHDEQRHHVPLLLPACAAAAGGRCRCSPNASLCPHLAEDPFKPEQLISAAAASECVSSPQPPTCSCLSPPSLVPLAGYPGCPPATATWP